MSSNVGYFVDYYFKKRFDINTQVREIDSIYDIWYLKQILYWDSSWIHTFIKCFAQLCVYYLLMWEQ